ncbi:MAG: type IV-A pilus assembly ATPase PilB [Gemmatimonadota bacterium]|nr:type IV-A pilus assembly ATPase PilB [Gemmatimonadota bacterium]MDP6529125.1 type IV-A pilus assembly ATPase PilB [Gemmatimonadota bacterium]MDP6802166.1 type IV-A pilus assembly ATPase PilB [Gemmatimonadota bacterium]MDP7031496.1 type IV-A pilus assembly ATPase PilB [Gemmatimonadota bacterium]
MDTNRIETLLLEHEILAPEQLAQARTQQKSSGDTLDESLVKLGIFTEQDLLMTLARIFEMPAVDLPTIEIPEEVLEIVPSEVATRLGVLPVQKTGRTLTLAMADPLNIYAVDDIKFIAGLEVQPVVASEGAIRKAIDRHYGTANALADIMKDMEDGEGLEVVEDPDDDDRDQDDGSGDAPVIKYVNSLLAEAVMRGASDIHVEPFEKHIRVRLRQDGTLHEMASPPYRMKAAITSRLKLMAELDIAERRVPQDGRIKIRIQGRMIDLRVSSLPVVFGEKIVLRVLDQTNLNVNLEAFGFDRSAQDRFEKAIGSPYGMVLVTGPTGSGKTTTLYSALSRVNVPGTNIMTVEDPVEYNLEGINQVQVHSDVGLTFASALKSFLRQDPNIVMVGEIRDQETASIAVTAALTGHLVLSTIHTNDAASTIDRLVDMGVPPFLVSSSLNLVVAQRLLRRVCPECRKEIVLHGETARELEMDVTEENATVYEAVGCPACHDTGYRGRTGIFEVLALSPVIRRMVLDRAPGTEIKRVAVKEGMLTLRRDAVRKMMAGETTPEEVLREAAADETPEGP